VWFKLDENLPAQMMQPVAEAGHEVATVSGEGISGCEGQALYEVCREEQRTLVTLDMDFANPLRFRGCLTIPPHQQESMPLAEIL